MESGFSKHKGESTETAPGDSERSSLGAKLASRIGEPIQARQLGGAPDRKPRALDTLGLPLLHAFNYAIPDLSTHMTGMITDWHQLIILGNGFDLQCGLHSQFSDFFGPRLETIAAIPDSTRQTWSDLVANSGLTLWDFILEGRLILRGIQVD